MNVFGFLKSKDTNRSGGLLLVMVEVSDCDEDVDILADGIKIQCKVRKTIPKWLQLGTCDWVLVKEDRGENSSKITRLKRN